MDDYISVAKAISLLQDEIEYEVSEPDGDEMVRALKLAIGYLELHQGQDFLLLDVAHKMSDFDAEMYKDPQGDIWFRIWRKEK